MAQGLRISRKSLSVKRKITRTALDMLGERGYNGTKLNDILNRAKTSKGSAYHQFPGGKDEIIVKAIRLAHREVKEAMLAIFAAAKDPSSAMGASVDFLGAVLINERRANGFPITTIGLELKGKESPVSTACVEAINDWRALLNAYLSDYLPEAEAKTKADALFCLLQGALVVSQITGDPAHLENAKDYSQRMLQNCAPRNRQMEGSAG